MKFTTASWHYRFNTWFNDQIGICRPIYTVKPSICPYFWYTVSGIVCAIMIAPVIAVVFVLGRACGFLFHRAAVPVWDKVANSGISLRPRKPKSLSLAAEWLKAKKQRVCPIIEWEAPEESVST